MGEVIDEDTLGGSPLHHTVQLVRSVVSVAQLMPKLIQMTVTC